MESIVTTEIEAALISQERRGDALAVAMLALEESYPAPPRPDPVVAEREATHACARRVLDVFYDVDREFRHIELGLIH